MHKEGQPNQASPQPDRRGERRGGPKKNPDSALGPGWATRLGGTYLGYGYRVIEVYPPLASMQVLFAAQDL